MSLLNRFLNKFAAKTLLKMKYFTAVGQTVLFTDQQSRLAKTKKREKWILLTRFDC